MGPRVLTAVLIITAAMAGSSVSGQRARIDIDLLARLEPGWTMVEAEGDATQGSAVAERLIWPRFYLHWRPLDEGEKSLSPHEAGSAASELWQGLVIDAPPVGQEVTLPAHRGWQIDTTLSHGETKVRYVIWSCPQSQRLLVADMSESLKVAAPPEIPRWMEAMTRSIKCHEGADSDASAFVPVPVEIPGAKLSLSRPEHWLPIEEYRVQSEFGGHDFTPQKPMPTPEKGQWLLVPADAAGRLRFEWGPAPDGPLTYNILREHAERYLASRAGDMAITRMNAEGPLWIAEGFARMGTNATTVPPSRMRSFRAWMWRAEGKLYFAVVETGGIHLGRRKIIQSVKLLEGNYANAYKALVP